MEFQNPHNERVMIVIMGAPCTGKSEVAKHLGKWVPTSVLYIDDFLCAVSLEKGYTVESPPPSEEEAERLYNAAFDSLCNVATLEDRCFKRCVIIKCRLDSEFERDRLIRLSEEAHYGRIIIIECWVFNEFRWRNRVSDKERKHWEWYKPGSWGDIEKAKKIYSPWLYFYVATGLVLDPFEDLNLHTKRNKHLLHELSSSLLDAINFLMGEDDHEQQLYTLYSLRRSLMENEAAASRERSKYLCTSRCILKYWDKLMLGDEDNDYKCGVCDDQVASGQPAYTCYYCILALHKSCAELHGHHRRLDAPFRLPETYPCGSCKEGGKGFSGECNSCLFQTHLKCRLVPAIIKHECHEHFLSLNFSNDKDVVCKACGVEPFSYAYGCSAYISYACYLCNEFYCMRCASLPVELKHGHGGYDHVMELRYYFYLDRYFSMEDGVESYWCDICYKEMDPDYWFYTCQQCPYYAAHARCVVPLNKYEEREDKEYYESNPLEE